MFDPPGMTITHAFIAQFKCFVSYHALVVAMLPVAGYDQMDMLWETGYLLNKLNGVGTWPLIQNL